jgi:hypothetical protein
VDREIQQQDVERILRDVLSANGLRVSMLAVERTPNGWRVALTDTVGLLLATDLPDGPPAIIRAALTRWVESIS